MTRILVTGASGFIGKHLVRELTGSGADVQAIGRSAGDVADESTWSRLASADVVIHLAGKSFVPESWADPAEFIRCNLLGTVRALSYARDHKARLVFLSSYLYGESMSLPIPETAPIAAKSPYALSKKLAEDACRFFSDSFGVRVTVLRPFNVYGPGQSSRFLIPTIIHQMNEQATIRVKDLEPRRDYVFVVDLVRAIVAAAQHDSPFAVFNVGSGVSHSVKELIDIIQMVWRTNVPVYTDGERRKDEIMDTVADITLAKRTLGWTPEWSLSQGIAQIRNLSHQPA